MMKTYLIIVALFTFSTIQAQLKGTHLLSYNGLQAGTQGPPGVNLVALPMYLYHTTTLKNGNGDKVNADIDLTSYANGAGAQWVSNKKFLNANWGGMVLVPFLTNTIEAARTSVKTKYALSDLLVQPVQLGWHQKQADFIFSYQLYIPTGRYEVGGSNNSGLGQWGNELTAATTLKFGEKKTTHFATAISYEINSEKKNSEMKTGNNLSLEGGLGKTWYKKAQGPIPVVFNAGIIYYMQFKTTDDNIPVPNLPIIGPITLNLEKDQIYGVGAEGNVFIPSIKSLFLFRWVTEMGAVSRFQGNTYLLMWAFNLKSFVHMPEKK